MRFQYLKKFLAMLCAATCISIVSIPNLEAQGMNGVTQLLQQIEQHTNVIMSVSLLLQSFIPIIATNVMQIAANDDAKDSPTPNIQGSFTTLGNLISTNIDKQMQLQTQLNKDLLGSNANQQNMPFANDMVYSTVLGSPVFNPDPRKGPDNKPLSTTVAIYNYIKNASGVGTSHVRPEASWNGKVDDINKYINYFSAVTAIQSYGGYVLSNQYADGNQLNDLQKTLVSQASNADNWFSKVSTESIGAVLRQLLLYQSQMFVLLTQMVQTEKQIATAQVMTNTLLILNNTTNEGLMVNKATSPSASPV